MRVRGSVVARGGWYSSLSVSVSVSLSVSVSVAVSVSVFVSLCLSVSLSTEHWLWLGCEGQTFNGCQFHTAEQAPCHPLTCLLHPICLLISPFISHSIIIQCYEETGLSEAGMTQQQTLSPHGQGKASALWLARTVRHRSPRATARSTTARRIDTIKILCSRRSEWYRDTRLLPAVPVLYIRTVGELCADTSAS